VNKNLNSICSSYEAIKSLQKIWNKPLNSYGLVLRSLYELFEASKSGSFLAVNGGTESSQISSERFNLCSEDE